MRHSGFLLFVFIIGLLFWAVWYLPARVLTQRVSPQTLAGVPLVLDGPAGTAWHGQASWHWRNHAGRVDWQWCWHDWHPGVELTLTGSGLKASGWVWAWGSTLDMENLELSVPLALVLDGQPQVSAEGSVSGRIGKLKLSAGRPVALDGQLHYGGGNGRWHQRTAVLPEMDVHLTMQKDVAEAAVTNKSGVQLVLGSIDAKGIGQLLIYRSFAQAVGVGDGKGMSTDVIFKASQPLLAH
jgi:hypothetical protein